MPRGPAAARHALALHAVHVAARGDGVLAHDDVAAVEVRDRTCSKPTSASSSEIVDRHVQVVAHAAEAPARERDDAEHEAAGRRADLLVRDLLERDRVAVGHAAPSSTVSASSSSLVAPPPRAAALAPALARRDAARVAHLDLLHEARRELLRAHAHARPAAVGALALALAVLHAHDAPHVLELERLADLK